MKKVLAVSGGIDSVVMLHAMHRDSDVIVAHFNHHIRPNADDDQQFVQRLAEQYGLPFVALGANLGADASEAEARVARYDAFFKLCDRERAQLYVAHHRSDIYESIAINILRGTGWRGLAPLRNARIQRPLLNWSKSDIYRYATEHNLTFRQDQTNTEETYLRNRVRIKLRAMTSAQAEKLQQLYESQVRTATEIDEILAHFTQELDKYIPRDIFIQLDDATATELLRYVLLEWDISQTRPQLRRGLAAIRAYQAGKRFPLNKDYCLDIAKNNFSIKKS